MDDEPLLPKVDYYLDESDPDIVVLRRQDGAFAAAFSAQGATKEGVIEANAESLGLREEGDRHRERLEWLECLCDQRRRQQPNSSPRPQC